MALTVEPDTINPSRINITGDGFSFDLNGLGTMVNIEGVGKTVTVTYADPMANIQWGAGYNIPSYFIRYFNGGTFYPIIPDWASGATLGNIDVATNFQVYWKIEAASLGDYPSDISFCGNKMF